MVSLATTMTVIKMKAYTYIEKGHFEFVDKPKPELQDRRSRWMCLLRDSRIEDAYKLFENKEDGLIKVEIDNRY